jgi:hypothetical protein
MSPCMKVQAMKVLAVSLVLVAASASVAGAAGTPCADFLKISPLPRIAALGDAGVALSDAPWAELNPANLTAIHGSLVTFSHAAWFQDISLEMLSIGTTGAGQGFGISAVALHTDPLHRYNSDDLYEGEFRYYDLAIGATYARSLPQSLRAGITAKSVYEKIDWDSASGFALDLGLGWSRAVGALKGEISSGLVMRNLGTKMGFFDKKYDLPMVWQGGVAYRPAWLPRAVKALVAVDYRKPRQGDAGVLVGAEVALADMVALRVGSRGGKGGLEGGSDFTMGVGLAIKHFMLDYAYVDPGSGLGATHRISLALRAGRFLPIPED